MIKYTILPSPELTNSKAIMHVRLSVDEFDNGKIVYLLSQLLAFVYF